MDIAVKDNAERSRFEGEVDGLLAIAEYELSGNTITFTHTEVPSHHQGQGIGGALAKAALDSARARNLTVVPRCKFIASYIDEHAEYQDLVKS